MLPTLSTDVGGSINCFWRFFEPVLSERGIGDSVGLNHWLSAGLSPPTLLSVNSRGRVRER